MCAGGDNSWIKYRLFFKVLEIPVCNAPPIFTLWRVSLFLEVDESVPFLLEINGSKHISADPSREVETSSHIYRNKLKA